MYFQVLYGDYITFYSSDAGPYCSNMSRKKISILKAWRIYINQQKTKVGQLLHWSIKSIHNFLHLSFNIYITIHLIMLQIEFAFLLSSKAGGCSFNLIGGDRLVLFDHSADNQVANFHHGMWSSLVYILLINWKLMFTVGLVFAYLVKRMSIILEARRACKILSVKIDTCICSHTTRSANFVSKTTWKWI